MKIDSAFSMIRMDVADYDAEIETRWQQNENYKEHEKRFHEALTGFDYKVKDPIDSACIAMLVSAGEAGFDLGFETAMKLIFSTINK